MGRQRIYFESLSDSTISIVPVDDLGPSRIRTFVNTMDIQSLRILHMPQISPFGVVPMRHYLINEHFKDHFESLMITHTKDHNVSFVVRLNRRIVDLQVISDSITLMGWHCNRHATTNGAWTMTASSNGSAVRITGPLWGESSSDRFPSQRPVVCSALPYHGVIAGFAFTPSWPSQGPVMGSLDVSLLLAWANCIFVFPMLWDAMHLCDAIMITEGIHLISMLRNLGVRTFYTYCPQSLDTDVQRPYYSVATVALLPYK